MKRFKFGFLAVIAVLAMSFTIATKTEVLKHVREASTKIADCFGDVTYAPTCGTSATLVVNQTTCTAAQAAIDKGVLAITTNADPLCGTGTKFCCATLRVDDAPCIGQPKFTVNGVNDFYEVDAIYCYN